MSKKITRHEQRRRRNGDAKRYHRRRLKKMLADLRKEGRLLKLSELTAAYVSDRLGQDGLFKKVLANNPVIISG